MANYRDTILEQVLLYAKNRWCWDDTCVIKEAYDTYFDPAEDTVKSFVDEFAREYDLIDPLESVGLLMHTA